MATVNGQNFQRIDYSFTRPADTTAYASGDLVANSTTAGSVTPLSWVIGGDKPFSISVAKLRKSGTTATNASFALHLFSSSPTISTVGDNGALASAAANSDNWLGSYAGTLQGFNDGCVGLLVPEQGVIKPDFWVRTGSAARTLYGLLEARAAYTPGNAETFKTYITVEFEP